ncbi:unnamed protein product [Heterobilharzia americana]|nr:unnamed protein product [Heterobilharzia americana]
MRWKQKPHLTLTSCILHHLLIVNMSNDDCNFDDIQSLEMEFLNSMFEGTPNHSLLKYDKVSRCGSFIFHPHFPQPIELVGPKTKMKLRNDFTIESAPDETNKYRYILQYLPIITLTFILPSSYPGLIPNVSIPKFSLSSIWLPISILSELERKLTEIANEIWVK